MPVAWGVLALSAISGCRELGLTTIRPSSLVIHGWCDLFRHRTLRIAVELMLLSHATEYFMHSVKDFTFLLSLLER